jgi:hypothetical protein
MSTEPEQPLIPLPGFQQLLAALLWLSLLLLLLPWCLGPFQADLCRFSFELPQQLHALRMEISALSAQ